MHVRGERKKEQLHHHLLPSRREHPEADDFLAGCGGFHGHCSSNSSCLVVSSPQVPRSTKTFAGNPDDITDNRTRREPALNPKAIKVVLYIRSNQNSLKTFTKKTGSPNVKPVLTIVPVQ